MATPRNNLEDVLRKRRQAAGGTAAASSSEGQDGASKPKFRAAGKATPKPTAPVQQGVSRTPSASSFSTPGFGKKRPQASRSSPVLVSSADSTPTARSTELVPYRDLTRPSTPPPSKLPTKRNSPSSFHVVDPPPKRPRSDLRPNKENVFDTQPLDVDQDDSSAYNDSGIVDVSSDADIGKGKGRELPSNVPPQSQRMIDFNTITSPKKPRSATRQPAPTPTSTISTRTLTFRPTPVATGSVSRIDTAVAVAGDSRFTRHLTLDYSDLSEGPYEELVDSKLKHGDLRSRLVDLREEHMRSGSDPSILRMLQGWEMQVKDKLKCIEAAITARKFGQQLVLPPPLWELDNASSISAVTSTVPESTRGLLSAPPDDSMMYAAPAEPRKTLLPSAFADIDESMEEEENAAEDSFGFDHANSDDLWNHFEDNDPIVIEPPLATPPSPPPTQPRALPAPPQSDEPYQPSAELTRTEYYPELIRTLREVFRMQTFRKNQLEACTASMAGEDVFNLMPTAGGKSLCFQLPAIVRHRRNKSVTVVVGPLVSLMADQVAALRDKGIAVACFTSDMSKQEATDIHALLHSKTDRPAFLYVTPEKLDRSNKLQRDLEWLYEHDLLGGVAIDEAHCIATWGRSFRDTYTKLDWFRKTLPEVPIMALTATANRQAIHDIIDRLGIPKCKRFIMSFNRPNLYYEVRPKGSNNNCLDEIAEFINRKHRDKTGIIYVTSRDKAERFANHLRDKNGLKTGAYHAKMPPAEKERLQSEWKAGRIKVIVATIAFGMGIDKPDVRFVIHNGVPSSLSGYYQETGRAGRDGNPSDCILFYSYADAQYHIQCARDPEEHPSPEDRVDAEDHIRRVIQYCQNSVDCRRSQVLAYFDETFDPQKCRGLCDNCRNTSPVTREDVTDHARAFVRLVQEADEKGASLTRTMCIEIFLGKISANNRNKNFDSYESFAAGRGARKDRAERIFDHLQGVGVIEEEIARNGYAGWSNRYVMFTAEGRRFLRDKARLILPFRDPPPKAPRKTRSKAANEQSSAAQAKKPASKRTRKPAEIPDDPIGDFDSDDNVPGPSVAPRIVSARSIITVQDDDSVIDITDSPQPESSASSTPPLGERWEACVQALIECRNNLSRQLKKDLEPHLPDDILAMLATENPTDFSALRKCLVKLEVDLTQIDGCIQPLNNVILHFRAPSQKPQSKKSKPPSINDLQQYGYNGTGVGSSNRPRH